MNETFRRIRWRLAVWNLVVLAAILLLLGWAVQATLSRTLMEEVDRDLADRAAMLASRVEVEDDGRVDLEDDEPSLGGAFLLVLGPDRRIVANPQRVTLEPYSLELATGRDPGYADSTVSGVPVRLYAWPLVERRRAQFTLVVGQSVQPQRDALGQLLLILLAGGGVGLVLSLLGAWFLAGRALVPIQLAFHRQQEFVADASHELRTPLTVLRTIADLLDRHRAEPLAANSELFDDARREIGRMEKLVGDLLTLARSDLGEAELAMGELDLGTLADEVTARMGLLAEQRGVRLSRQKEDLPLFVEGDPDRLQQVVVILLDNALKATSAGGSVTVVSRRLGASACIEVKDTGKGIPPEHLSRVFDRFYRVDKARSREHGGAGLGLAIARSLVEAHGGQLSLDSVLGAGTTARVCLPLEMGKGRRV
ncbi:MAG: sensor histidine kinase [Sphingomonadaceae bacterium]